MGDHHQESCRKRMAVVVGCNYPKTQFQLHGCINDALSMADLLVKRMGFDPLNIELLIDDHEISERVMPTGANVKNALGRMVDGAQAGDVLFFHFSGHGTRIRSHHFREGEAIVPCDFNLITDVDFKLLVNRLPKGATFTILSDSCHSGGLIDQEKEQIGPSSSTTTSCLPQIYKSKFIPYETIVQHLSGSTPGGAEFKSAVPELGTEKGDGGILLSGCEAKESSMDIQGNGANGSRPHGAFTFAVVRELSTAGEPPMMISNRELVMRAREVLKKEKIEQHPCLYSSDQNADSMFLGLPPP